MSRQFEQGSPALRTLDFDRAPELGEISRHNYRARLVRRGIAALVIFWSGVICTIIVLAARGAGH